jgi:hypothetical protein
MVAPDGVGQNSRLSIITEAAAMTDPLTSQVVNILRHDKFIARHNFAIGALRIWPRAYHDVADAITAGKIRVGSNLSAGNAAQYDMTFAVMDVSEDLNVLDERHRAVVFHEATHAHLDMLAFGEHSGYENEAMGYIAEALYTLAAKGRDVPSHPIRVVAKPIAAKVYAGMYAIPQADVAALTAAISAVPAYNRMPRYTSNGL